MDSWNGWVFLLIVVVLAIAWIKGGGERRV
jgi:hypothetical protein